MQVARLTQWSNLLLKNINIDKSLSEAGIIKHNATQRASAFTHTDTHIEGRGKVYYNVAGKE